MRAEYNSLARGRQNGRRTAPGAIFGRLWAFQGPKVAIYPEFLTQFLAYSRNMV